MCLCVATGSKIISDENSCNLDFAPKPIDHRNPSQWKTGGNVKFISLYINLESSVKNMSLICTVTFDELSNSHFSIFINLYLLICCTTKLIQPKWFCQKHPLWGFLVEQSIIILEIYFVFILHVITIAPKYFILPRYLIFGSKVVVFLPHFLI
jgi:hypothetical protein